MTIKVTEKKDGTFDIEWNEKDPQESIMNTWTESDFLDAIQKHLDKLKQDDGKETDLS
jgi:hypothetical protein